MFKPKIMKQIIFISILIFLSACKWVDRKNNDENKEIQIEKSFSTTAASNEAYESIDVSEINIKISQNKAISTPKEIIKIYYPFEAGQEGKEEIIISERILSNGNNQVTLIHDYQLDDAVRGVKYVMELKKEKNNWIVLSLKKNWKCYANRGHVDWGIVLCD